VNRAGWLAAISLVWGYAVFQWGGVVGLDRKIVLLALGFIALAWWLANGREAVVVPGAAGWCWWLLPAYAALQLVPLPRAVLGIVSPARAEMERALDAAGARGGLTPLAVTPGSGMNQFLLFAGYALVFFLVFQIAAQQRAGRWLLVLPPVIAAVLEASAGIAQSFYGQVAAGTYVNRDHYAGLLEMALPFALAYPLARWRATDTRRVFPIRLGAVMCAGWGASAVMLAGSLASLSRAGVVAPLFGALAMGIVAWRGNGWRAAGAVAVLAAGLGASFVLLPSDALIARFVASGDELSAEGRLALWRESLGVARAFPVFGCGMGGYESAFLRYKVSAPMVSDDHAHNDYLQFLIELGVAGFAIGALLIGSVVRRAWRAAARRGDAESRFLAIACIGAFAAIGLHSMVDFNLYIPANAMLLAWISGVAAAVTPPGSEVRDLRGVGLALTIDVTQESAQGR
jgi:O-antigen ligase